MSTQGIRDFRPELHFTPKTGWINDPNGLVYENGKYHLFAQYHPEPHWGPMHWCHAVSTDLIHWEHLPVAISPDELGMIFSGSAVYDENNTSGFGQDGKAPIVAMYTSHGDHEQESIAYSTDGVHFTKYEGNPVIPNTEIRDFRDPKVFHNPIKNCWGMVLASGDHINFYSSPDLKAWTKTGEFAPGGMYAEGQCVCECPDFFPLPYGEEEKWVLIISMSRNEANHGSRTHYYTGSFDGDKFTADGRFSGIELIDDGLDNYAGVTFFGAEERILIGWGMNWVYSNNTPTGEYCGQMTLPRALSLVDTPKGGVRLSSTPKTAGVFGEAAPCGGDLPGEVFLLTVTGSGASTVTLSNGQGQQFLFGINEENEVFIDRTKAGATGFDREFATEWFSKISAPRLFDGEWKMELIFDHSICELFLDNGTRALSQVVYPDTPYTQVEATGGAVIQVQTLK